MSPRSGLILTVFFNIPYIVPCTQKLSIRSGGAGISNKPLRYLPALWDQYVPVFNDSVRNNTLSERLVLVRKYYCSLYIFFEELRKKEADKEKIYPQLQICQKIRRKTDKKGDCRKKR